MHIVSLNHFTNYLKSNVRRFLRNIFLAWIPGDGVLTTESLTSHILQLQCSIWYWLTTGALEFPYW